MAARVPAHEWVSFEDPNEERTWLVDATFLLSNYTCIFGAGCQGVLTGPAPELVHGCCSYGAHFSDEEDIARVEAAAATLSEEEWQFRSIGMSEGFIDRGEEATITALVDDACIFLNRPGFAGGIGCAFHIAAGHRGIPFVQLKPEVCWQVPVRREDLVDATGHITTTITQWERRHWGEAGEDFYWWCTEAPEAFVGKEPAYRTLEAELTEIMGAPMYAELRRYLDQRTAEGTFLPHPAVRRRRQR